MDVFSRSQSTTSVLTSVILEYMKREDILASYMRIAWVLYQKPLQMNWWGRFEAISLVTLMQKMFCQVLGSEPN